MRRKPCAGCGGPKDGGRGNRYCVACSVEHRELCVACGGPKRRGRRRSRFCQACDPACHTPCAVCGKSSLRSQGRSYCDECREFVGELREARHRAKLVLRRKPCRRCGGAKKPGDNWYCQRCVHARAAERTVVCRTCGKNPPREPGKVLCMFCWAESRERQRAWWRARQKRLKAEKPEVLRGYQKAWRDRNPRTWENRENDRMGRRLRMMREGHEFSPDRCEEMVRDERHGRPLAVPGRPLAAAIQAAGDDLGQTCDRCGVSERTVYEWRYGTRAGARYSTAELVLIGLDMFWWEVFDPEACAGLFSPVRGVDVVQVIEVIERASEAFEGARHMVAA